MVSPLSILIFSPVISSPRIYKLITKCFLNVEGDKNTKVNLNLRYNPESLDIKTLPKPLLFSIYRYWSDIWFPAKYQNLNTPFKHKLICL